MQGANSQMFAAPQLAAINPRPERLGCTPTGASTFEAPQLAAINPRPELLGCTPTGASALAAPQLAVTTQGLRDSDTRPQGPLHSQRHSLRPPGRPNNAQ